MEVKILESDQNSIRFVLNEATTAFANALRRLMMSEVPTLAIDDVVFFENSSPLFDEIIAHRLGLVPLKTDLDSYSELGKEVRLVLKAEAVDKNLTVYSRDLQAEDPAVTPVHEQIPLLKLGPGQRVTLEATAKLGRGKEHSKWQPVYTASYKCRPIVTIDAAKCDPPESAVDVCPVNVFGVSGGKLKVEREADCILCRACEEIYEPDAVTIGYDNSSFIFRVESSGALPVLTVIQEAAKLLETKSSEFLKQLDELGKVAEAPLNG